jgi:MSHA biogenesis protein MshN
MSVINQMLKDLDKRNPESNGHTVPTSNVELAYSPKKIVLVTGVCVLVTCLIGFYVWQLISENNALKANKFSNQANGQISKQVSHQVTTQVNNSANAAQNSPVIQAKQLETKENKTYTAPIIIEESQQSKNLSIEQESQQVIASKKAVFSGARELGNTSSNDRVKNIPQKIAEKSVVNSSSSRVSPAKKAALIADDHSHSGTVSSHSHDVANVVTNSVSNKHKTNTNKMSVS